jgi:hypothetical protein
MFAVEAWTIPMEHDEEPCEAKLVRSVEVTSEEAARRWAWDRLEEGYFVRLWRR